MGGKILSVFLQWEIEKRKTQEKMALEHWRSFFRSATDDIFQVIENSIHIASQDHPSEFSGRCQQLIKSFTDPLEHKNEEDVMIIKDFLTNRKEYENLIFESLRMLQSMELSVGVLKATKIEKIIKPLRKHPIKRIKHLAKLVINCWKLLKDEQVYTAKITESYNSQFVNLLLAKEKNQVSFLLALPVQDQNAVVQATKTQRFNRTATIIHSQTEHMNKEEDVLRQVLSSPLKPDRTCKRATNPQDVPRNPVKMTSLPQGFEQNMKPNDQLVEARLETKKRKLQDAYLKKRLAKKQCFSKVIEFKDAPKTDHCNKMNDRCCPKKWTNCPKKRRSGRIPRRNMQLCLSLEMKADKLP